VIPEEGFAFRMFCVRSLRSLLISLKPEDESEMQQQQSRMTSDRPHPRPQYMAGDHVMILSGPWAGASTPGTVIRVVPGYLWVMSAAGDIYKLNPAIVVRLADAADRPFDVVHM
jgi:hypothetical protein